MSEILETRHVSHWEIGQELLKWGWTLKQESVDSKVREVMRDQAAATMCVAAAILRELQLTANLMAKIGAKALLDQKSAEDESQLRIFREICAHARDLETRRGPMGPNLFTYFRLRAGQVARENRASVRGDRSWIWMHDYRPKTADLYLACLPPGKRSKAAKELASWRKRRIKKKAVTQ